MDTKIISAFCGTGKTFVCERTQIKSVEVEYWKYIDNELQNEYVECINSHIGNVEYIFVSTDPTGLMLLHENGFEITLIYPENNLRNEYLDRYINRDSAYEFIGTFMKHWNIWIDELKKQSYCTHIVLKGGQYLQDVLTPPNTHCKVKELIEWLEEYQKRTDPDDVNITSILEKANSLIQQ